ncbi:MAG: hypothetical protein HQM09_08170 [Candidatus Riflebacteria bacterium]|nr:hypothetical protein [Candidatus Riflebacteria bacterium]
MDDPTISRIRMIRKEISSSCENDPEKFIEYYIKLQKQFNGKFYEDEISHEKEKIIKKKVA